jgi:hypothetical protein
MWFHAFPHSLQRRMRINAQYHREAALAKLRALLLRQRLAEHTLDVHHRVLSALHCLSRQPLGSTYRLRASLAATLHSSGDGQRACAP